MKEALYFNHILEFKQPSGTSRGILKTKETFILEIFQEEKKGIGECAIFRGLSYDDTPEYEKKIQWLCENINEDYEFLKQELLHFPSIWLGYEQAMLNLEHGSDIYFPSDFTHGKDSIKINGLIWMGTSDFMQQQILEKLDLGFDCIKLKIGVDWNSEREILKNIRQQFDAKTIELRVDANGAFSFEEAKNILQELADLEIHSIEQPIKKNQLENKKSHKIENKNIKNYYDTNYQENGHSELVEECKMSKLCAETPIPIALDEELIGVVDFHEKRKLLEEIKPQYIILKPSLVGGFSGTDEWISIAEKLGIGWWITSALESNIGLNAIAQYTYMKQSKIPQGLGTGALFTNNFDTKLELIGDQLTHKI